MHSFNLPSINFLKKRGKGLPQIGKQPDFHLPRFDRYVCR
jgi:hypothetical protein